MLKLALLTIILWILLFALRIIQIGGIDPTYREPPNDLLKPFQENLVSKIDQILPYPQSALLSGILLGSQERLPFNFKNQLKDTSTIHMVVVSGQNLSILAGFLMGLVYLIGRRKTIFITLLAVLFYSLLTGFQVPVIRAAIMVFLASLAQILGKEGRGGWILVITAGAMLLYNPNWLLNISFQLSFAATFGVMVVAPLIASKITTVPHIIREDLATTFSAQMLVLPILAYNFQQVSLAGVLSNLLILWTIPIVMVAGFITLGIGLVNTFLGQVVGLLPGILLTYFINVVQIFAMIPGVSMRVGESSVMFWLGYYLLIGAGIWILYKKFKNKTSEIQLKN